METLKYILLILISYGMGSINVAVLISTYILHRDVRNEGSGNAGATNVARVFGMKMGVITLLCDFLKTVLAMCIGHMLLGEDGLVIAAAACLVGHSWPVFFKFKGGKGVAVSGMIALMLDWRLFVILVAVFAITFLLTKTVSICSIVSAISFPIAQVILGETSLLKIFLGLFIFTLVTFQHRLNIARIVAGKEPKFKPKAGKRKS